MHNYINNNDNNNMQQSVGADCHENQKSRAQNSVYEAFAYGSSLSLGDRRGSNDFQMILIQFDQKQKFSF